MTIKEVEMLLDIPRATVRFYEKEGLISPTREGNGYRDYSDEDVEKLKKIIIFRKIGLSIEEINDLFDGVKTLEEVLDANIVNLQKQMEEWKGAMKLSQKMKEDTVQISSMDVDIYWNTIEEEEKQGNQFIDIAKDIVEIEKGVLAGYFSCTDINGKPYDSLPKIILNIFACVVLAGVILCIYKGTWSAQNFWIAIQSICALVLLEMFLSIPWYFLGKRFEWIRKNRRKLFVIAGLCLVVILLILANMFGS